MPEYVQKHSKMSKNFQELQKTLDLRRICDLKVRQRLVKLLERLEKPLVQLGPLRREVELDENGRHQGQLLVRLIC